MFNIAARARPYFGAVVLTTALLTAGGIYSYTRMPSSVYPEVTFPRISVVARMPGLDVRTMEVKVTQPLEQAVTEVIGVAQVRSKTIRGGSELSVEFNPGMDMRRAETLTWNRIGAIRSQLPANVDLTVEQMTPTVFPIISLVLTAKTAGLSPAQLRDYAYYKLAPSIKNLPDVYRASVAGGDVREIEVEARPEALFAAGLSAADLADQIGKVHRLTPVGRIERGQFSHQVMVNTQGETARQIEELVISTKGNQPLRVRDVADVRALYQDRVLSVGFEQKDAVVITIFRRLGGNTVNISNALKELLAKEKIPANIKATIVYDQAEFVETSVHNVRDAILIGGLFSILILLAFLRSIRATIISALAIPTTLAITFLFLHWSGETLNLMSLGGLAVAIGLIIDDTVVVVENIARHLTTGADPHGTPAAGQPHGMTPAGTGPVPSIVTPAAAIDAASSEITGAVVGSTLTTVLVFVPLAFIVGVYGQFFASLSWSLSIAVLVSMVISLTLVPVFAAKFLAGRPMPGPGPIYRSVAWVYELGLGGFLRVVEWLHVTLQRILRFVLGIRAAGFLIGAAILLVLFITPVALGLLLFLGIPDFAKERERQARQKEGKTNEPPPPKLFRSLETDLMPAMDEGAFVVDYLAPSGTPLEETERMAKVIEEVLSENPDVRAYVRRTGAELGIFATQTNRGDIQVVLRSSDEDPLRPWTLFKPMRPKWSDLEKEYKAEGREMKDPAVKEEIRAKYRRRPIKEWSKIVTQESKDEPGKKERVEIKFPGVMDEIEDELKDRFAEHQLKIELVQIMADELNDLSGANKPVEVKIFGPDHAVLRDNAKKLGEIFEKRGKGRGIKEVNSNVMQGNPDLMVVVDGVWAARNVSAQDVERQLTAIYLGQVATSIQESATRITDVRVRYPDALRFGTTGFNRDSVLNQRILLPEGLLPPPPSSLTTAPPLTGLSRSVPLGAVADVKPTRTPEVQWRENQQPAIFITAENNEAEAGLGSVAADINEWMGNFSLPSGYRWEMGGNYIKQQEAFDSLERVMLVAIVLVFIMLAFQFRSIVLPLLIFMTQPLSIVSGLFALWLTETPLNVSSYMGIILLIGLDMKNGILLVEYIQQLRQGGMELRPALLLAGRTRFRPILMTSLAAILGLLPLAFGIGPGSQMQQLLAIVVIGGLTANMLFTRMIIPVGYLVMERMKGGKPIGATA
jgi:multidrug efflux pump subunit AcrB